MTDDLSRRLAEQILRGVKDLHVEHNLSEPLSRGPQLPRTRAPSTSGSSQLAAGTQRR